MELHLLDLSSQLKTRQDAQGTRVYDPVRKKWVSLAPEEMVRQLFLHYCLRNGITTRLLTSVERQLGLKTVQWRYDLAFHRKDGTPWMLVECKAPAVELHQSVFDQVARYNLSLRVPVLTITNGRQTLCCLIDHVNGTWKLLDHLPSVDDVT